MATCPQNSTVCLLRAILDAQSGFNWDPPTFWTTLGISIVALYFALVSIIQGVLSVSPGRLKASRGEIDYWSQWTQWNISFAQLRLRTTAYVPIIQHPTTSLNLAQDDIRIPTAKETKNRSLSIRIYRGFTNYNLAIHWDRRSKSSAGWVSLLRGLEYVPVHLVRIKVDTDNLPSDVQAAPALGRIETIVKLAALAGCDSIALTQGYPVARGNDSQLLFRDHPNLGITAVYQKFPLLSTYNKPMIWQDLYRESFAGKDTLETIGGALQRRTNKCHHPLCNRLPDKALLGTCSLGISLELVTMVLIAGTARYLRFLPFTKLEIRRLIGLVCKSLPAWSAHDKNLILSGLCALLRRASRELVWDCSQLPAYRGDRNVTKLHLEKWEGFHVLQRSSRPSWCWVEDNSERCLHYLPELEILRADKPEDLWVMFEAAQRKYEKNDRSIEGGLFQRGHPVTRDDGSLVILPKALFTCLDWLADEKQMGLFDFDAKGMRRADIAHQLQEVDFWLHKYGGPEAACETWKILDAARAQLQEKSPQNLSTSSGVQSQNTTADEPLRTLLIYRAVLFAVLCATAADSSCVENSDLGNQIVQFI